MFAAGGIASLALRADAGPTDATRDVHGFQKFLDEKGRLTKEIMPDFLHPKEKGYGIWADAIEPKLKELGL